MNGKVVANVIKVSLSIHRYSCTRVITLIESIKWQLKERGTRQKYLALAREHYHRNINTNSIAMVN